MPINRRDFLTSSAARVAVGLTATALPATTLAAGRAQTISLFHTTDLHGRILPSETYDGLQDVGGLARCASCIRQWRRAVPASLTVDVGDVVQGTPVSFASDGRLMIDLFNAIGYDAWAIGNHDFDWGPEALEGLLDRSTPAVLSANLERSGRPTGTLSGAWEKVRPWQLHDVGGFKVALVGLTTPGLASWLPPETLGGVLPTDPAAALQRSVIEARAEGAEAVVVIGHMGWRFRDNYSNPLRELLRNVRGVDVYLAGHSHQNQPSFSLHDVLCSQASYYGIHCGRVDLTFDTESRKIVDSQAYTLLMDDRFELDPAVMQRARPDLARSEAELARVVCTVAQPIRGGGRNSGVVTLLCELFAETLARRQHPVDGVFHGSFGTEMIPPGDLTVGDCWRLVPYENRLVTVSLSAKDLAAIVAEDAGDKFSDRTLWPFTVHFDASGTPTQLLYRDRPVKPDERFTIAVNSYDSQSGGRRLPKLRAACESPEGKRTLTALDSRTAVIDGLLERGRV